MKLILPFLSVLIVSASAHAKTQPSLAPFKIGQGVSCMQSETWSKNYSDFADEAPFSKVEPIKFAGPDAFRATTQSEQFEKSVSIARGEISFRIADVETGLIVSSLDSDRGIQGYEIRTCIKDCFKEPCQDSMLERLN